MNPRLLLLEDDPTSAAYLSAALAALPARVDVAGDLAAARRMALAPGGHALWLFDLRLPDGRGDALLAELRAAGFETPALALSADPEDRPAGFVRVLAKPIGAQPLRDAVLALLPAAARPPWDDAAGLAAVAGQSTALATLRRLFLDELPGQREAVASACRGGRTTDAHAALHRLKAGCGFVGALALLDAVRALDAAPGDEHALRAFEACVDRLLDAT